MSERLKKSVQKARFVKEVDNLNNIAKESIERRAELKFWVSSWEAIKFYLPWCHSPRIEIFREVSSRVI